MSSFGDILSSIFFFVFSLPQALLIGLVSPVSTYSHFTADWNVMLNSFHIKVAVVNLTSVLYPPPTPIPISPTTHPHLNRQAHHSYSKLTSHIPYHLLNFGWRHQHQSIGLSIHISVAFLWWQGFVWRFCECILCCCTMKPLPLIHVPSVAWSLCRCRLANEF